MKLISATPRNSARPRPQRAFAIILVLGLLALMVIHGMSLSHRLHLLDRELGQLEKEQIFRLQSNP